MPPTARELRAELTSLIGRHAIEGREIETPIGGLYIGKRSRPTEMEYRAQWPCVVLVAQGAKTLRFGRTELHYGAGDCLLVSLDMPVVSTTVAASPTKPYLGVALGIHSASLAEVLRRAPIASPRPVAVPSVSVDKASPELLEAMVRMLRLLDRPEDAAAMAPLVEQEILYRVLTGPGGARLVELARSQAPANRIARAMSWLRARYAEPLRIDDLAARVGMSPSSLHHHFRAVAAMTPLEYQKNLRLHEARRLIVVESVSIGEAATRVGYQSLSQFSREYRRYYGVPASHHMRRL